MNEQPCFAVVRNIPKSFHSSDLRNFFSQLIEEKVFLCFHYKHRPEVIKCAKDGSTQGSSTNTCVIKFTNQLLCKRCIDMFDGSHWVNANGDYLKEKCRIVKFSISNAEETSTVGQSIYQTQKEKRDRRRHAKNEFFSANDLLQLSELNPPAKVLPCGNVGTPMVILQDLIRQCLLPTSLIKSLGLIFPKSGSNRRYGNVPYKYEDTESMLGSGSAQTASGHAIVRKKEGLRHTDLQTSADNENLQGGEEVFKVNEEDDNDSLDDDDDGEEWERHDAFHDDVTTQERTKERLFEEEIELKWEKGGSGLVFYTDAQYWAEEEKDFDDQTADDWDVDMSMYYGGDGDKDARDFMKIQQEKRLRRGEDVMVASKKKVVKRKIGDFERHTKGIGRKVMESLGWNETQTLGPDKRGLMEPLEAEGQTSRDKMGLGYHGEKLVRSVDVKKQAPVSCKTVDFGSELFRHQSVEPLASHSYIFPQFRSNLTNLYHRFAPRRATERMDLVPGSDGIVISTVFDQPLQIDSDSGIMRSQQAGSLKCRKSDKKVNKTEGNAFTSTPVTSGSKLVKRSDSDVDAGQPSCLYKTNILSYADVKFVRPSSPSDRFIKFV